MRKLYIFILLIFLSCGSKGHKVLVVFPLPGISHGILGDACVQLLLEAGHQVTYLTRHAMERHPNLTVVNASVPLPVLTERYNLQKSINREVDLNDLHEFSSLMSLLQRSILEKDVIQQFLNDTEEQFDVAILEWLHSEFISGIPAVFGCPYMWLSSMDPHFMILNLIDETTNPAYVPMTVATAIPPFTFMERALALKNQLSLYLYREFWINRIEEREFRRLLGPTIARRRGFVPTYDEVRFNASIVLGNSHVSVGKSIHLPEAYKEIGGYHVRETVESLPQDLKSVMDMSTNGVIYFSLGSTLLSKDFPEESKEKLLKVFGGLKQTVLWKYETDLPNRPRNVHVVPWSPQQSILAHPNCVLFITHGGQLSVIEAVHFGVPLIGIPVFADQTGNVKVLVKKGMAKEVKLSNNIAGNLQSAIEDIITNTSYAKAAKDCSFIYHNRVIPPSGELQHWVRHVVEYHGAVHLRSAALMVPWYQKCFLDVAAVVIVLVLVIYMLLKRYCLTTTIFQQRRNTTKKEQ